VESIIRVLVVDDSAFARYSIIRELESDAGIKVVGYARNGLEALEQIKELKPDVVTLDVEMPRLNGIDTLHRVMLEHPTPVIMLSSLTGAGTETTIRALELGAVDFFLKSSQIGPLGDYSSANDLKTKIRVAAGVRVTKVGMPLREADCAAVPKKRDVGSFPPERAIVIGCSTGGPRALYQIVPSLPTDLPAAILIVQHMPQGFTRSMAKRLNQLSGVAVKEAAEGDAIRTGEVLVAPGGYHMIVNRDYSVGLSQGPLVCGVRPSVDVTMRSAAAVFGASLTAAVLTGMGTDGTEGTGMIRAVGGRVIAESESTSVVWGMPRSVIDAGNADRVLPLPRIVPELVRMHNVERRGSYNE